MIEQEIDITTADGAMNTFLVCPDEGGPFPVVLFLMDAPGKREELHDMARRIASVGYYVMLPNLYYRKVREYNLFTPGETRERMQELMGSLSNKIVCEDIQVLLDYAAKDDNASDGPAGATGYCMSGPFAYAAAAAFPDRIKAALSIHGVALYTDAPDSPHLDTDKIKGELYFGCAETDSYAPTEMINALEDHLKSTDVNARVEWYPKTEHGFVFPGRPTYEKASAERHWERLFAIFERNLK